MVAFLRKVCVNVQGPRLAECVNVRLRDCAVCLRDCARLRDGVDCLMLSAEL
jgi:hypothetical protein